MSNKKLAIEVCVRPIEGEFINSKVCLKSMVSQGEGFTEAEIESLMTVFNSVLQLCSKKPLISLWLGDHK